MKIYQAGPLFSQGEQEYNLKLAAKLRAAGHEVFLPQEKEPTAEEKEGVKYAKDIFNGDVNGVRWADVVVAILDGADVDSGTSFEVGLAYGLGKPIIGVR